MPRLNQNADIEIRALACELPAGDEIKAEATTKGKSQWDLDTPMPVLDDVEKGEGADFR